MPLGQKANPGAAVKHAATQTSHGAATRATAPRRGAGAALTVATEVSGAAAPLGARRGRAVGQNR